MRTVSILTGVNTHLDHLGVLSHLLKIPLIVTEEQTYALAKKYYPDLDVLLRSFSDLSLQHLADHFDVIFETGKFWAADLSSSLKLLHDKDLHFVFCPHGNSDKGHSMKELVSQDISLVYGEHLIEILKRNGSFQKIKKIIKTGNYRYTYYKQHKIFYDQIADHEVFHRFKDTKPVVLYAPTWNNAENPTSFFSSTETIIEQLANDFNLLIKLHPFLEEHYPAHVYALTSCYQGHESALFLSNFPPIYPLLERSAIYIGDYSSIGYDFLAFNKPLFFLPSQRASYLSPLYQCGPSLFSEDLAHLNEIIKTHLQKRLDPYSILRHQTYLYAFGEERAADELRADIFKALNLSKSSLGS